MHRPRDAVGQKDSLNATGEVGTDKHVLPLGTEQSRKVLNTPRWEHISLNALFKENIKCLWFGAEKNGLLCLAAEQVLLQDPSLNPGAANVANVRVAQA